MRRTRHVTCLRGNKGGDVAESYFSGFYRKTIRTFEGIGSAAYRSGICKESLGTINPTIFYSIDSVIGV